jgi:pimeloyl-ACP methyl ester carboxylesterase
MVDSVSSTDGISIAYEARGEGSPALVFVHGWSCDRGYWAKQMATFAGRHRVVAVDLAGHGDSGAGREEWTIPAFGADVSAVVDALGLERVVLVGHSLGGDVIVEAARRLPGRIAGLVWVDAYRQLATSRTEEQHEAFTRPFRGDFVATTLAFVRGMFPAGSDPALVERVAADMAAAPPEVALPVLDSAIRFDRAIPPALRELGLPLVALNPDLPESDVASYERCGGTVVTLEGSGHFPMLEDPARFDATLAEVLEAWTRREG